MAVSRTFIEQAGVGQRRFLLACFSTALLIAALSIGWGRAGHDIMLQESAETLPMPLSKLLRQHMTEALANVNKPDDDVAALRRKAAALQQQADQPDASAEIADRAAKAWQQYNEARSGHFFDIDAMTDLEPPFADFPHNRQQAVRHVARYLHQHQPQVAAQLLAFQSADELPEKLDDAQADRLGRAAMHKYGRLPWQISDRADQLETIFRQGEFDRLPAALGELAHYVADLHQPLHTTHNYDGKFTGNQGIHSLLEIHIINRHLDHYQAAVHQAAGRYKYQHDPLRAVFQALARNYELLPVILRNDSDARRQSQLSGDDVQLLKSLTPAVADALMLRTDLAELDEGRRRIVQHVDLLHEKLIAADDPVSHRLADAATMFASIVYTAWVNADRPALPAAAGPAGAGAAGAAESEDSQDGPPETPQEYARVFLIIGALLLLLMVFGSRFKRRPPPNA